MRRDSSAKAVNSPTSAVAMATPDASVVVPVNAKGDLDNVLNLLRDIGAYRGPHTLEVILVVNNYESEPPEEVERYRALGAQVVTVANVRRLDRPGEAVCLSAKIPGVRVARSNAIILWDADCRVPDVTSLLNWYVAQFHAGAQAAYTAVGFYDWKPVWGVRLKIFMHHASRWAKRNLLGIPTTRGSNYAVRRDVLLDLYDRGVLADDLNVGPAVKALKGRVAYSGRRRLIVRTSGRTFTGSLRRMVPYFAYRIRYNLRVLPVRLNAQQHTHRERHDPADRYDYTQSTPRAT